LFDLSGVTLVPSAYPSEVFWHYSIPALDQFGGPVAEPGSAVGSNKFLLKEPVILVSKLNPRKPRVQIIEEPTDLRRIASTEFMAYAPRDGRSHGRFYYWFFSSAEFQGRLARVATGSTNSHVRASPQETLGWLLPLPTMPEQRCIALLLDAVDEAIRLTEQVIGKLQLMKQGLLHDLLTCGIDENGELRDPVRHPEQFKDSKLGRIPNGWDVVDLGTVVARGGGLMQTGPFGSQLHAHEYVKSGVPVVMPQDIGPEEIDLRQVARITAAKATELSRHKMRPGDALFARRGDLSRCARIEERERDWLCGTGCLLVRPGRGGLSAWWLSSAYRHDLGQRHVRARAVGSTMVNLNTSILATWVLPIPPTAEQEEAASRAAVLAALSRSEQSYLDKLSLLKSGLMDDLLTGRVRVKSLEESA
jgi:type I restriction enzyme S subunit